MIHLRPYQERGVRDIRAAMAAGHRRVLYVAPTGSGKSVLFAWLAHAATQKGRSVTVLVHRRELVRQARGHLAAAGSTGEVRTVQEMARKLDRLPDLLIVDEAHHSCAGTGWAKIVEAVTAAGGWVLGVTATPARLDGQGLGQSFDVLVRGPKTLELIDQGWLAGYRAYAPPGFKRKGIARQAGDFARRASAKRARVIVGDAVKQWREKVRGPAIAFCCTVEHAGDVAREFRDRGHRSAPIDGRMGDDERADLLGALAAGDLDVLTSCDLISEGFDCPEVRGVILMRPTKSLALHLQQLGRALRPKADRSEAVILDHVGNVLEHGLPDHDHAWSLAGRADVHPGQLCLVCWGVSPPGRMRCVSCGAPFPPPEVRPRKQTAIERMDGELEQIDPVLIAEWRTDKRGAVKGARNPSELRLIVHALGWKPGFAYMESKRRGWIR